MSCQHLKIRSHKNPDFQCLLENENLEGHLCPEYISKSQGLTSSEGPDVLIPFYGGDTNLGAAMPGTQ